MLNSMVFENFHWPSFLFVKILSWYALTPIPTRIIENPINELLSKFTIHNPKQIVNKSSFIRLLWQYLLQQWVVEAKVIAT